MGDTPDQEHGDRKLFAWLEAQAPGHHPPGLPAFDGTDGDGVRTGLERVFREAGMPVVDPVTHPSHRARYCEQSASSLPLKLPAEFAKLDHPVTPSEALFGPHRLSRFPIASRVRLAAAIPQSTCTPPSSRVEVPDAERAARLRRAEFD